MKIDILCLRCKRLFSQSPHHHLAGSGCPRCCVNRFSKPSLEWLNFINVKNSIIFADRGGEHRIKETRFLADGYCEDTNTIYEFQGCYFHGCPSCYPDREKTLLQKTAGERWRLTRRKKDNCLEQGYKYIEIMEHEWQKAKRAVRTLQRKFRERATRML